MNKVVFDNRVERIHPISSPKEMIEKFFADDESYSFILEARKTISNIINQRDPRFLVIVGPCSIHNIEAAQQYAERLSKLQKKYSDSMYIIMRAYFEKPRTVLGWRGLIVDPELNGVINILAGLEKARQFLIKLAQLRLAAAVELVDQVIPQYLADLVSWSSVGARSAESQMHRELASGLSMPIGFKNTTSGDVQAAINGVIVSHEPHAFITVERNGKSAIVHTMGNPDSHLILRGGNNKKNCDRESILHSIELLNKNDIIPSLLIDCSHGNSQKIFKNQIINFQDIISMRYSKINPIENIRGCMIESFLQEGRCAITDCHKKENFGKSITDPCISWEMTEKLLADAYQLMNSLSQF